MFCYQCEQTAKGQGCAVVGVCGKESDAAELMDALIVAVKGIAQYGHRARKLGVRDREVDRFLTEALFSTLTNVCFDPDRLEGLILKAGKLKDKIRAAYEKAAKDKGQSAEQLKGPALFSPASGQDALAAQGRSAGIETRKRELGDDAAGVIELITYGLKGVAAYAYHAAILGKEDDEVYSFLHECLDFLAGESKDLNALLGYALKTGEINLKVMELLDAANTDTYGHPEPTRVRVTPKEGKAIVVSGHDLKDLEELLKQTAGKGINVYTHGEMLPCNAYPGLKKYKHLAGNYGGAWQDQKKEFDAFPGAILMTTNCIQKPKDSYKGRIFTTGVVGWPGVEHVERDDFSKVIEAALSAPGFKEDGPEQYITIGFGRNTVLGVTDKVIDLVKGGKIKHFFLIGGCDGAKAGRNYYTDFAKATPKDTVMLTLACGKYRFNKLEFGDIEGIPRLLDVGQCNDAYSAVKIALALADAFKTDVNSLPLSMILSWYEQKAVAILLTLLYLGIRNIKLGPSLPAFVTPAVLNVLVDKFNISPTTTVEADLKAALS